MSERRKFLCSAGGVDIYRGDYLKVYNPYDRKEHVGWAVGTFGPDSDGYDTEVVGFYMRAIDPLGVVYVPWHGSKVELLGDCRVGYDFLPETEFEWRQYASMLRELEKPLIV